MKKNSRFLSLLLAAVLVLELFPAPVFSAQISKRTEPMGTTANGIGYAVYDDHVEITGYIGNAAELAIPAKIEGLPVTGIGDYAFYECDSLTGVTIPEGVISIGSGAFYRCDSLTSVKLPDTITAIGDYAFYRCGRLPSIMLPQSVSTMGDYIFTECSSLSSITIPEGVTRIGVRAFWKCLSLASVTIPGSVEEIDNSAFYLCGNLSSVTIQEGVLSIGTAAFSDCYGLESVTIPSSVTVIGSRAFYYCSHLTDAEISVGVSYIGNEAFRFCLSLTDVTIPGSVAYIGENAFTSCIDLTGITFCGDAPVIEDSAFSDITATVHYPAGNNTWTADVMRNYGGELTWVAYEHIHDYEAVVTAPTCTEQGYTTHTCLCGSYVDDYVDALGHNYGNGCCIRCGDPDPDCPESPFIDVPRGTFFYFPVLWAVEEGITNGIDATHFGPFLTTNRAAVVTMLWRYAGSPAPGSTVNPFTDVPLGSFYYDAVLWAVEKGITNGLTADTFGPAANCNRAQVVTFLWRFLGQPEHSLAGQPFTDVAAGSFYEHAVLWALENNITTGATATTFNPAGQCLRAQFVTFLYRTARIAPPVSAKYTVTFHGNGGSAPAPVEVEAGQTISRPDDPVREGYLFTGWFTSEALDVLFLFDHDVITSDIDLYAGWHPEAEDVSQVNYAADRLAIGYHQGDYAGHVTADVTLPSKVDGADGVTVTWQSSSDAVSADGRVTRPEGQDEIVTLTAQLRKNHASMEVPFVLKLIHRNDRDPESIPEVSVSDIEQMNEGDEYFAIDTNDLSQVISIDGSFSDIPIENAEDALDVIESIHKLVGLGDPYEELALRKIHDNEYKTSYTFAQEYNGFAVYSLGITVSADSQGNARGMSAGLCKTSLLDRAPAAPMLTAEAAQDAALQHYTGAVEEDPEKTKLVYYALNEYEHKPALVYLVYVSGTDESGEYLDEMVFVDSQSGEVLHTNTLIYTSTTGSGRNEQGDTALFPVEKELLSGYAMEDIRRGFKMYTCKPKGSTVEKLPIESSDNTWNDPTAVSAYTNVIKTYDWYKAVVGRVGLRDDYGITSIYVHEPSKKGDSFWHSGTETLNFCDNLNPNKKVTTAGALDIVAHEYTHGVFCFETGILPHENMTGAINEGYADIMSNFVDGDWLQGEDWILIRNAADPDAPNVMYQGPDKVSHANYVQPLPAGQLRADNDYGGIHTNSLLLSHAAYLMCEEYGLNRYTAAYLWYLSMSEGYSGKSTYKTVRQNVLKAARAMELSGKQIESIKSAFDQVEIWESSGTLQVSLQHQNGDPLNQATVIIDDEWTYTNIPSFELALQPGEHTIKLSHPVYTEYTGTVSIKANKVTSLNLTPVGESDITVYPSHVSFVTKDFADLCRKPAETDERDVVATVAPGESLISTALYELSMNHYWRRDGDVSHVTDTSTKSTFWYEVTYDGITCCIHGEDTTSHNTDLRDIAITNVAVPAQLQEGVDFPIGGEISTTYTEISNVLVQITSDDGKTYMSCGDPFSGKRYELKDSIIDFNMDFRFLEDGSYTYQIVADTLNYYTTDGQTIQMKNRSWELYSTTFAVIGEPAAPGVPELYVCVDPSGEAAFLWLGAENEVDCALEILEVCSDGSMILLTRIDPAESDVRYEFGHSGDYCARLSAYIDPEQQSDGYGRILAEGEDVLFRVELDTTTVASGTCGKSMEWRLDGTGTLYFGCTEPTSYYYLSDTPWYDHRYSIKKLHISQGVHGIDSYAFRYLRSLREVDCLSDDLTIVSNNTFYECTNLTELDFLDHTTIISAAAFEGCTGIESCVIPEGVEYLSYSLFEGCSRLATVDLPESLIYIDEEVFAYCHRLTSIEIPQNVVELGARFLYDCTGLTELTIPAGVRSIGDEAMSGCVRLKKIVFEGDAPSFGSDVFADVIAAAYYPAGNDTWSDAVRSSYGGNITWVPYSGAPEDIPKAELPADVPELRQSGSCGTELEWVLTYDDVLTICGTGKMRDYLGNTGASESIAPWNATPYSVRTLNIEEGVTSIGAEAFEVEYALEQVAFPDSLENIGSSAFYKCPRLKEAILGTGIARIGYWAFLDCTGLESLEIHGNLQGIGEGAFYGCTNLRKILFTGDAPSFGTDAFGHVCAIAFYPEGNETWTADVLQNYGGTITWVPYCPNAALSSNA